jgi:hypothetical protein
MGRNILAVIASYIVIFILVAGGLTAAYFALGADRAFEAGTYEVTGLWIGVWALVSMVASVAAGVVCGKISKHSKGAVMSLMILIGVLGAANSTYMIMRETPPEDLVRAGDTSNTQAMMKAQAPTWMYIAEPIMGIVGVMIGAMLVCPDCRKKSCDAQPSSADEV